MKVSRFTAVAVFALTVSSCGSQGGGGAGGKLTVLLKDAPAVAVDGAVVTIASVELVGPAGSVVLTSTPVTTDLLTLAADTTTLVSGADIPAGSYTQLRFVISGGYLDVGGAVYATSADTPGLPPGTTFEGQLRMPSYAKSGLKVILPEGFTVGDDSTLVVDFDVSGSFGHDTGADAWVMHPVVKATEAKDTGALAVTLSFAPEGGLPAGIFLTDFQAALTPPRGGAPALASLVDLPGGGAGVTFPYLAPGDYSVSFVAPDGMTFSTDPAVPQALSVVAGQTATMDFTLIAAFFTP